MIFRSPHPDVEIPELTFTDFVLGLAERFADRSAFIEGPTGRTISYAELAEATRAAAAGFAARGLEKGDVVGICSPNVPEYAVAFMGVAAAGGVNTTVSPLSTVDDLVHQFADSKARFLITIPPLMDQAKAVAERTEIEEIFVFGKAEGATPFTELFVTKTAPPVVELDPREDLVVLPYSSGTTGMPKGVMLTHHNVVANICQYTGVVDLESTDSVLAVLPFFHIYGMVVVMSATLRTGASMITMPRFDFEECLGLIERYRINRVYAVPPIVLGLAKHPAVDAHDLSSVDWVMSGAAPLGAETAQACADRLDCLTFQGYGLTEASPVTHARPIEQAAIKLDSVGPAIPNTEVLMVDLETGEPVGTGQEGEVWVRGPQVMKGYLNRPDATADTLDDEGWLRTGDVGYVDDEGFLYIVDRAKELIKYKGYQVAPAELEELLISHAAIQDAAVIPSPDEEAGEVPKAFIVSAGELTEQDVMAYVAEHVAPYKKVRYVEFVDEIPKSPSGKILRRVLVAQERERIGA